MRLAAAVRVAIRALVAGEQMAHLPRSAARQEQVVLAAAGAMISEAAAALAYLAPVLMALVGPGQLLRVVEERVRPITTPAPVLPALAVPLVAVALAMMSGQARQAVTAR